MVLCVNYCQRAEFYTSYFFANTIRFFTERAKIRPACLTENQNRKNHPVSTAYFDAFFILLII